MPIRKTSKSGGGGSLRDVLPKSEAYKRIEADIEAHAKAKAEAEHEAAVRALAAIDDAQGS